MVARLSLHPCTQHHCQVSETHPPIPDASLEGRLACHPPITDGGPLGQLSLVSNLACMSSLLLMATGWPPMHDDGSEPLVRELLVRELIVQGMR